MRIASVAPFLGMLAVGLLSGCNQSSTSTNSTPAPDTWKVGEFASLTGGNASFGQSSDKGTRMAIDEINASGGAGGRISS